MRVFCHWCKPLNQVAELQCSCSETTAVLPAESTVDEVARVFEIGQTDDVSVLAALPEPEVEALFIGPVALVALLRHLLHGGA